MNGIENGKDMVKKALEKLTEESKSGKYGPKEAAMKSAVLWQVKGFAQQDEEFAQAIVQGGTFAECMAAVAKGVGNSLSDLDAYSRAVQFYFPGAEVHMELRVDLAPTAAEDAPQQAETTEPTASHHLRLDDFFD